MFENREYQIKDIMKVYKISRDTIKYYEHAGLIESHRKENGYRVFDEINMRKLKKIISFRHLGMTVEEIAAHCNSETPQKRMELLTALRLRTEDELRELNRKLKKIRDLEESVVKNPRFLNGFNADHGLTLCLDCPHMSENHFKSFTVISGMTATFTPENGLTDQKDCWVIKNKDIGLRQCTACAKKIEFEEYYRARIPYENKAQVEEILRTAYEDLEAQGIMLDQMLYIMKKVVKMNGKDTLVLDTVINVKK